MTKPALAGAIAAVLMGAPSLSFSEAHAEPRALQGVPADAEAFQERKLQTGTASWYGPGFHGRRTANGETFNTNDLTAAHRTLPFGTRLKVINERTGKSVVVRINDRGPYAHGRVIDLSRASAQAIGIIGLAPVSLVGL
jgi:rare lipoprotein A